MKITGEFYKMRFAALLILLITTSFAANAQQTTTPVNLYPVTTQASQQPVSVLDSVVLATKNHAKFTADSIAMQYIKFPDSAINKAFIDKTLEAKLYKGRDFLDIPSKTKSTVKEGKNRQTKDQWVIVIIIGLLIYMAFLNIVLNKDIQTVLHSFYSKRVVSQAGKEEGYINFWSFVGLFLLFGFTFGLFLYQLASYTSTYYSISGVRLFVSLSFLVIGLCAVKFVALKILGFIFDINKVVSEYVSILYLTYFNIAFVFLPIVLCFSLLDAVFIPYLLGISIVLIATIFCWLYVRSSVSIISNFRFRKFYLFVYLCALEICPILILIKALDL